MLLVQISTSTNLTIVRAKRRVSRQAATMLRMHQGVPKQVPVDVPTLRPNLTGCIAVVGKKSIGKDVIEQSYW